MDFPQKEKCNTMLYVDKEGELDQEIQTGREGKKVSLEKQKMNS